MQQDELTPEIRNAIVALESIAKVTFAPGIEHRAYYNTFRVVLTVKHGEVEVSTGFSLSDIASMSVYAFRQRFMQMAMEIGVKSFIQPGEDGRR